MNIVVGNYISFAWAMAKVYQPKQSMINLTSGTSSTALSPTLYCNNRSIYSKPNYSYKSRVLHRKVLEIDSQNNCLVTINRQKHIIHYSSIIGTFEKAKIQAVEINCNNLTIPVGNIKITPEVKRLMETIVALSNAQVNFGLLKCKKS